MISYLTLFLTAFGAATILPFYSEVLLAALLANGFDIVTLWWVATVGNTLGAAVNWLMGRYVLHFQHRSWFPFKPDQLEKSQKWFRRFGVWSLLFSWLPVGGDTLTFIAGIMRVSWWQFLILVFIGKGARYAVFIAIYFQVF